VKELFEDCKTEMEIFHAYNMAVINTPEDENPSDELLTACLKAVRSLAERSLEEHFVTI